MAQLKKTSKKENISTKKRSPKSPVAPSIVDTHPLTHVDMHSAHTSTHERAKTENQDTKREKEEKAKETLEDFGEDLGKRRPEEEGVGVLGRRKRDRSAGESEAASENLAAASEGGGGRESSRVWGT